MKKTNIQIINKISQVTQVLSEFLYPKTCAACHNRKPCHGQEFCSHCLFEMRPNKHFANKDNRFSRHFFGRIPIEHGAALFTMAKKGLVRNIIHELKYRGDRNTGIACGMLIGKKIEEANWQHIDAIIPVPLHSKKKMTRGYNQSEVIASGISHILNTPVLNLLYKPKPTKSQTTKSRQDRIKSLDNTFHFNTKYRRLSHLSHILIIDDVVTTGATLEACALAILEYLDIRMSFASIGIGMY